MKRLPILAATLAAVALLGLAPSVRSQGPDKAAVRPQWEYAIRAYSDESDLNRYGQDGWELVETHAQAEGPRLGTFKRPK